MSGDFQKILSLIDLDEASLPALKVARDIAVRSGGTIYLLHVVSPDEFALLQDKYRPWEAGGADIDAACRVAERKLEQTAQERIGDRVPHEVLTRVGERAETVLAVQKELGADLVVMGTRGRPSAGDRLLGTLAERVVHNSFCPVLTVPGR